MLVRMRSDKYRGGKTHNWLLIKHQDKFARQGDGEGLLRNDRSIASGRDMEDDRGRQGQPSPSPSCGTKAFRPDAVWHSNRGEDNKDGPEPAGPAAKQSGPKQKRLLERKSRRCRSFVAPQLCEPVERPPSGPGWVHEIKFDGYRLQLRVAHGKARLHTRKGLDWTGQVPRHRQGGRGFARRHSRRRGGGAGP